MNRCAPSLLALALACTGVLATLAPASAAAQTVHRGFTKDALRGKIDFGATPWIKLNGTAQQTGRGARIHDQHNRLVRPSSLDGTSAIVNYTLGQQDRVYEIWILTPEEAANKPWPRTEAEAKAWTFDAVAQTWTKP